MDLLVLGLASIIAGFCYIVITIYREASSPLRDIPGPFLARFSRLWYLYKSYSGSFHLQNIELHRKHGPIVQIAPNTYSIATPDKAVYGIASQFEKSSWYDSWKHPDPDRNTLFADRNIKRHNDSRRRVQGFYSMSTLVSYETFVDRCNELLVQKLRYYECTKETIDLGHWLQCYAFDVIGCITFSQRFGFLEDGKDVDGMIDAISKSLTYSTCLGVYSQLHPYLYPLLEYFPSSGAAGVSKVIDVILHLIDERKRVRKSNVGGFKLKGLELSDAPEDFLDKIMNAHEADPKKVTDAHMFILGWSNITAGSDTTGISLSAILYYLTINPKSMQRLMLEIAKVDDSETCTKFGFSFAQAQKMPFLQACIKEGLRLHSAVGLPLWRVVPRGGATVCGRYFPEGNVVGINSWVAHYNEDVFGADAKGFRPERWLEASDSQLRTMESYFIPFGLGSRTCVGRHISMFEISKVLPVLVRDFEFELVGIENEWKTHNHWFVKPLDFKVKVKAKSS